MFLTSLVLVWISASASSQDGRSIANRRAVGAVFDEVHIAEAASGIHERAAAMPIGDDESQWCQTGNVLDGGIITGSLSPQISEGRGRESLLQYHRPMLEDGTIEYDFYFGAGERHVHPALDRLAFMLQPAGVHLHWITDGAYDRTGLAIPEQELAVPFTDFLNDDLANLTAVREHDFSLDGLPPHAFTVFDDREPFVMVEGAGGLRMDLDGVDADTSFYRLSVAPRYIVRCRLDRR